LKSKTTGKFWKSYEKIPKDIKRQAKSSYEQFASDPWYPGLHFKRIHSSLPIYSARISLDYRAVGVMQDDTILWFWIGSHTAYDQLIDNIRKGT